MDIVILIMFLGIASLAVIGTLIYQANRQKEICEKCGKKRCPPLNY